MPLVLAVHTVPSPSANVPFAVILLQDSITNKRVPEGLKCRQVGAAAHALENAACVAFPACCCRVQHSTWIMKH